MNTRTVAIVGAAVTGTPLLAAAVLALCSPAVAVIVCLAVAAAGVVGTAIGLHLIAGRAEQLRARGVAVDKQIWGPSGRWQGVPGDLRERARFTAAVDADTSAAICDAVEQLNARRKAQ